MFLNPILPNVKLNFIAYTLDFGLAVAVGVVQGAHIVGALKMFEVDFRVHGFSVPFSNQVIQSPVNMRIRDWKVYFFCVDY